MAARSDELERQVRAVLSWYFEVIFGTQEGPEVLPFYCDPNKVGRFAVSCKELSVAKEPALFRLFIALTMFQGLRDVVIMSRQRSMAASAVESLAGLERLREATANHECATFRSAALFDMGCDVRKLGERAECSRGAGLSCHVKEATIAFNRMGDMGKLPTSALLHVWAQGGARRLVKEVVEAEPSPTRRASLLVERFAEVRRVGRKLATMFVSALATPALYGGLAPWFPQVDGNELVVVDTNVARAVDALRSPGSLTTYDARELWVREQAARIDLSEFNKAVPSYSPRLLQQAFYWYGSKANRAAIGDPCASRAEGCGPCVPSICPFGGA